MAVEALTIVNGPMAGVGDDGPIDQAKGWMRHHGVDPTHMAVGALVGASVSRKGFLAGALTGAAIVFSSELLIHHIR